MHREGEILVWGLFRWENFVGGGGVATFENPKAPNCPTHPLARKPMGVLIACRKVRVSSSSVHCPEMYIGTKKFCAR